MARVAFVTDKLLRKIGLSGRSIVPLLIGFGCTVPGVMASRTLPSARDRKMTILLTPYMSCSAKIPIYAFFSAAFFPHHAALVMIAMYITGILVGIVMSRLISSVMGTPTAISAPAILIAVVFSMVIGVVFGLLPAIKAANLNPIEALRRD